MKRIASTKMFFILLLVLVFMESIIVHAEIKDNQIVESTKVWTIKFNKEVVLDEVNKQNITVKDSKGNLVTGVLTLGGQGNESILVNPPSVGYIAGEKYILNIGKDIHSKNEKKMKASITMNFSIKDEVSISDNTDRGNTVGNNSNRGLVAMQGDFIYYQNPSDKFKLYKKSADGKANIKISDHSASNINVVGDWVYYLDFSDWYNSKIYKIRTDGTDETKIYDANKSTNNSSNEDAWDMTVIGDWIYFHDNFYNDCFHDYMYKIKTDGTQKTQIGSDAASTMAIDGEWIYYGNLSDTGEAVNTGKLYKVKIDGTSRTKISDLPVCYNIGIKDDFIYLVSSRGIDKINKDGSSIINISNEYTRSMNVVGDYIYYAVTDNNNNKIYRIDIYGENKTELTSDYATNINIVKDRIYYIDYFDTYKAKKLVELLIK